MLNSHSDELLLTNSNWEDEKIVHVEYSRAHNGRMIEEYYTSFSFHIFQDSKKIKIYKLIDGIFVHPDYRGKGIGKNLIYAMEDIAKKENIDLIDINGVVNPGFFNKMGYALAEISESGCEKFTKRI